MVNLYNDKTINLKNIFKELEELKETVKNLTKLVDEIYYTPGMPGFLFSKRII